MSAKRKPVKATAKRRPEPTALMVFALFEMRAAGMMYAGRATDAAGLRASVEAVKSSLRKSGYAVDGQS